MPPKEPSVKKSELVAAAAKRLGLSKARAGEVVDVFFGTEGILAGELRKGSAVQISGFGSFEPRQRGARSGRDPKTGKSITIRPSVVPAFRPGSALKELVNRRK
jgi:DNA-binding protein HU-beta